MTVAIITMSTVDLQDHSNSQVVFSLAYTLWSEPRGYRSIPADREIFSFPRPATLSTPRCGRPRSWPTPQSSIAWPTCRKAGGTVEPDEDDLVEFLRRLEIVDGGEESRPITTFSGDPKPTAVTLFLTTACNLRCTYCYASAGDTPTRVMPMEVAQRGIDFVIANALELGRPAIEIAYHGGGEPSVNWKTLTGSYDYAREQAGAVGLGGPCRDGHATA